ncbi:hypothetical protein [Burkholderia sp. WSM2232]|uniref:hypothetical protein n=1 Tax=Burkholderia sp. WSM2232 TaxID=944436 RepID=UPI000552C6C6|nr:hypothetical protein [Burkholderia sp. WSM2232]
MSQNLMTRIADLILADNDAIYSEKLNSDGKYQNAELTLQQFTDQCIATLSKGFAKMRESDFPEAFIAWGKCRVGSTALTNLFGMAGLDAYYQPVKTVLRHIAYGSVGEPWSLPNPVSPVFAKEMAGPYLLAECLYNPIEILLKSGYPAKKLKLIIVDREPVRSLDSWINKWSSKLDIERLALNYSSSALNAVRVESYAVRNGVDTLYYVYEASKQPDVAIPALFQALGIGQRFTNDVIDNWGARGALNSEHAKVRFPVEPPPFVVPGLHGTEERYVYKERELLRASADLAALIPQMVTDVYERHFALCCQTLGLDEQSVRVGELA